MRPAAAKATYGIQRAKRDVPGIITLFFSGAKRRSSVLQYSIVVSFRENDGRCGSSSGMCAYVLGLLDQSALNCTFEIADIVRIHVSVARDLGSGYSTVHGTLVRVSKRGIPENPRGERRFRCLRHSG